MKSLFVCLLLLLSSAVLAQNQLSDRIFFGGGGGFSAGSNQTNISVFPQVGYRVTDNYIAGVGITYQYVRINEPINATLSNYGWSVFNRHNLFGPIFAYAEFERLSFQYFINSFEQKQRDGFSSLLLGGGYAEQLGGRASFNMMVLYNVLYDNNEISPYTSPWVIRAGVGIGAF